MTECGAGLSPLFPSAKVVEQLGKEAARLMDEAIRLWSGQCKMTPEEWLGFWQPKLDLKNEAGVLTVTVSAVENPACVFETFKL